MKANAPEKIYLQVCGDCPHTDCDNCKFEDLEDNITCLMINGTSTNYSRKISH